MNRELERAKAADAQAWTDAAVASAANLKPYIKTPYAVVAWSNATRSAFEQQWCPVPRRVEWDWSEIARRYAPPRERVLAVRAEDRLCALAAVSATRLRVKIHFLEGDPRQDCPLQGQRATIILDLAATYGQRLGCEEIQLEPVTERLRSLYCGTYGFHDVMLKGRVAYLRRSLP